MEAQSSVETIVTRRCPPPIPPPIPISPPSPTLSALTSEVVPPRQADRTAGQANHVYHVDAPDTLCSTTCLIPSLYSSTLSIVQTDIQITYCDAYPDCCRKTLLPYISASIIVDKRCFLIAPQRAVNAVKYTRSTV